MGDFKQFIEKYAKLLPVGTSISFTEAERRAGEFLHAMATITTLKHDFSIEKIKLQSVQSAVYSEELNKATGKTVTENKVTVEASITYQKAREDLEFIDADISYLKAYYDIFMAAHVFYRNLSKDS
jgi:hypothetical protein